MALPVPIRTLIVDDEPHARTTLRLLTAKDSEIEIVGEAANGPETIDAIRALRPDLVFLDVQIPEKDGFEVLRELRGEGLPRIVFVTAYDQYALQAFEVNAVDYLLKPFDDKRFFVALNRVKEALRTNSDEPGTRLAALLEAHEERTRLRRVSIKSGGRIAFLGVEEIDWIEAADQYVELHVGPKTHLLRESMSSLESKLPPDMFCRIHRSTIVNVNRIKELHPQSSGDSVVVLEGGVELKLARARRPMLTRTMGL